MLSRRYEHLGGCAVHDTRIAVDLKRLDPRLAISLTLILGLVVIVAITVLPISLCVMARSAKPAPDRPMQLQETPRSRRDSSPGLKRLGSPCGGSEEGRPPGGLTGR